MSTTGTHKNTHQSSGRQGGSPAHSSAQSAGQKRELTPEERRRRQAARRRRQKELARRRRRKRILAAIFGILGIAALVVLVLLVYRFVKGGSSSSLIEAKGDTFVIALDPGHGGEDIGMSNGDVTEKAVTLAICEKVKVMLESQGYEVVMTRSEDSYIAKEDRVSLVNSSSADLLVSVHCGYSDTDASQSGAVLHYQAGSGESEALAAQIEDHLVQEAGVTDGGSKAGSYTILTDTQVPAVLVEAGYLSNAEEASRLADDSYENEIAKGIAKGIILSLDRS